MNRVHLSVAVLAALVLPTPGHAQRVIADISIHEGPVTGRVIVGHPPVYHERAVVVVAPRDWRPVTVYRFDRAHRAHDWYRARGYRSVRIWFDPNQGYHYDRYHRGLVEISVYQHGGRYYRSDWRDGDGSRDYRGDRYGNGDYHDRNHHNRDHYDHSHY
jgi:hypothetical protein